MNTANIPFVRVDVTAVKYHGDFIFAGIGSYSNIFNKRSLKLLQRILTLKGQKIYGFVPSKCGRKVLCFGGKQFTILKISESSDDVCVRMFEPVVCDDWLHSAVWVEEDIVAVLTAHNTVQFWNTITQALLSQHESPDNSILYSGLLLPLEDEVLVLAGTVFSEVIIWFAKETVAQHHLRGHRGVIFSISCDLQKEIIVTTSDDRSIRIWASNNQDKISPNTKEYWKHTNIVCRHELYGHAARVMRSCIINNLVISIGEDAAVCIWNHQGTLLRKNLVHQNGCLWSVDADNDSLVTGGGDCGVMVHPLMMTADYLNNDLLDTNTGVKKVVFTSRRNIVMMTDDLLIYCNVKSKEKLEYIFNHTSTYKLLSMSPCKQIIAITDMDGNLDVYIENCKEDCLQNVVKTKLDLGKILSMHWGDNRHLILCSQDGAINIVAKSNEVEKVCSFNLPACKERWLTAAAIDLKKNMVILGDRCGNIHVYFKGDKDPVKTFCKVHGRYGPTSITVKDNEVISTGRDGTIRYFVIQDMEVKYMSSKSLEFPWVEKFLDKDENVVCGFHERDFIVYDVINSCKMLEVPCGGGHRSWDAVRLIDKINDKYDEVIKLIYIKNPDVRLATFQLSKIVSRSVINGSHSKEINCLKCYTNASKTFYISGGEATTLRISCFDSKEDFIDRVLYKHLSNIRTLKLLRLNDERSLLISAGGRAQMCVNILNFIEKEDEIKVILEEVLNYQIKGTDKEKKGNQNWRNCTVDFDPETRIMDVDVTQRNGNEFTIFAGCSDAYLRIYSLKLKEKSVLKPINEIKSHKTCILKTQFIKFDKKDILVTCTTRGEVTLWDVSNTGDNYNLEPFFNTTTNKSGINSLDTKAVSKEEILLATGGDDNAIHLILLKIQNNLTSAKLISSWHLDTLHSSQITGLCFSDGFLLSTSIDQRVSLLKWEVHKEVVACEFVSQTFSDVADVQGMDVVKSSSDTITVCVYGKGMEVINIHKRCQMVSVEAVTEPVWLGEGPHWDAREQALYFVSIFDKSIHRYDPSTGRHTRSVLSDMPGFVIPVEGKPHRFVVGLKRLIVEVEWDGKDGTARELRTVAEVDQDSPGNRFNDAKADPRGRLFAGTMGNEYEPGKFELKKGCLYRLDPDGQLHKLESGVDISNGLCWDVKEKAFYFADSFEYDVRRYDYDIETGNISNPRLVFSYKEHGLEGIVDGMTIDTDGNLWIANFDGHQIIQVDPRKGKLLQKIRIPALQVTSATFGGPGLDVLYVTSACMNRGTEQKPPCGATFRVTGLGVKGYPNVSVKLE